MPFAETWIDLEIILLREVSQTKKCLVISLVFGIFLNDTNELIYRTERDSQT